jgi:UDP-N-acetylmuramoyl-L-alanine---L-glutamate ligase
MFMRFSELDGAKVGVWGAGREIRSFASQLRSRSPSARIAVVASDDVLDTDVRETLAAPDATLVGSEDAVAALSTCDLLVRSPGVSIYRPELLELRARGVRVCTATGLWLAETGGAGVIGVTGTKGKSTTAALIFHLMRSVGVRAHLAGNIGAPALDLLDMPQGEVAVVELSSYQLADLEVGPEVAVLTNLYREHTDWHGSYETYRKDKLRVLGLPGVRTTVLNARDPRLAAAAGNAPEPHLYGRPSAWDVADGAIACNGHHPISIADLPLRGEHNALNLCAALSALEAHGVATPALPEALIGFATLPHRLELVAERDGVLWIDDSISTTPESTIAALASFPDREIVLLGGGEDRGQDHTGLADELVARGATLIGLPVTGSRLVATARDAGMPDARALEAREMGEAVAIARRLAQPGSVILLSPAAPSYNAYRDFEERGSHFRDLLGSARPPG